MRIKEITGTEPNEMRIRQAWDEVWQRIVNQTLMQEEKTLFVNELAMASLTIGITSFIQLIGMEKSIPAIVFGILALKRLKYDQTQRGKNLAIAGIILGVIYTIIALAMLPHALEMARNIMGNVQ